MNWVLKFNEMINNRLRGVSRMESFEIILVKIQWGNVRGRKKFTIQQRKMKCTKKLLEKYVGERPDCRSEKHAGRIAGVWVEAGNRFFQ